jgi:hypothetical protein
MGRPSNAQVAARSTKVPQPLGEMPDIDTIPKVERSTAPARTRIDAREYAATIRANRKSFSGLELKLAYYGENPGWHRRWVNEDNVPLREQEGYRFVLRDEISMSDSLRYGNQDMADRVSTYGGKDSTGKPFNQYLMEIPDEIAGDLDERKSISKIRLNEQSIISGAAGGIPTGNSRVGEKDGLPAIKINQEA